MLAELRRLEQYTDRELDRSDERLRGSSRRHRPPARQRRRVQPRGRPGGRRGVVIDAALSLTGLERACVIVVDDETGAFEAVASVGYDDESLQRLVSMDRDAQIPGALALRTGRPVYTDPQRALGEDYPDLARLPVHASTGTLVALPLLAAAEIVGVLALSGARRRGLDETEREVLGALAAQAGQALQRALLYEAAPRGGGAAARSAAAAPPRRRRASP